MPLPGAFTTTTLPCCGGVEHLGADGAAADVDQIDELAAQAKVEDVDLAPPDHHRVPFDLHLARLGQEQTHLLGDEPMFEPAGVVGPLGQEGDRGVGQRGTTSQGAADQGRGRPRRSAWARAATSSGITSCIRRRMATA